MIRRPDRGQHPLTPPVVPRADEVGRRSRDRSGRDDGMKAILGLLLDYVLINLG